MKYATDSYLVGPLVQCAPKPLAFKVWLWRLSSACSNSIAHKVTALWNGVRELKSEPLYQQTDGSIYVSNPFSRSIGASMWYSLPCCHLAVQWVLIEPTIRLTLFTLTYRQPLRHVNKRLPVLPTFFLHSTPPSFLLIGSIYMLWSDAYQIQHLVHGEASVQTLRDTLTDNLLTPFLEYAWMNEFKLNEFEWIEWIWLCWF